ncbi:MAG: lmo0937 family membrane protein [Syntrophomonadaceae bacterium]
MLWNFFILFFLWLIGMTSSYTLGGAIHLLLIVAVVTASREFIRVKREKFY